MTLREWEGSPLPDETNLCLMSSKPRLLSVNVCASEKQASLGYLGHHPLGKLSVKAPHVSILREFVLLCLLLSPFGSRVSLQKAYHTPRRFFSSAEARREFSVEKTSGENGRGKREGEGERGRANM